MQMPAAGGGVPCLEAMPGRVGPEGWWWSVGEELRRVQAGAALLNGLPMVLRQLAMSECCERLHRALALPRLACWGKGAALLSWTHVGSAIRDMQHIVELSDSSPFHSAAMSGELSTSSGVSRRLWLASQDAVMRALHSPFVIALASGLLPR